MRNATARQLAEDSSGQPSKLLPALLPAAEDCEHLTVLHIGPAQQDTLDFFSEYRCQLHIRDLFSELPLPEHEDEFTAPERVLAEALQLPQTVRFDVCLFWDWFNYLDAPALSAFLTLLEPHLHSGTRAHAFGVHNLRSRRAHHLYGVQSRNTIGTKPRSRPLPGYSPHSQRELKELLVGFDVERSVLLPDSRLELLLFAKPGNHHSRQ